jgi:hypothetical protein
MADTSAIDFTAAGFRIIKSDKPVIKGINRIINSIIGQTIRMKTINKRMPATIANR